MAVIRFDIYFGVLDDVNIFGYAPPIDDYEIHVRYLENDDDDDDYLNIEHKQHPCSTIMIDSSFDLEDVENAIKDNNVHLAIYLDSGLISCFYINSQNFPVFKNQNIEIMVIDSDNAPYGILDYLENLSIDKND